MSLDPSCYAAHARFVPLLGAPALDWLAPKAHERILDLGCGDGLLSERIAAAGARVVGIDASAEMISVARARGLDARVGDAQKLSFESEFDAVFSNAALHWMQDQDGVFAGVRRALKVGGRFVGELGAAGNLQVVISALLAVAAERGRSPVSPWRFPTREEHSARLVRHGFVVERVVVEARPTRLPTDLAGWLDTFGAAFFDGLSFDARRRERDAVVASLAPSCRAGDGTWTLDYVRLRFAAVAR